jgi:long-chain acyl-CoA synthetase
MRDARTLVELFAKRVATSGDAPALRFRAEDRWTHVSWSEWRWSARRIAAALVVLGVGARDRVGIVSRGIPEWLYADMGIQMAGAVTTAIFSTEVADRCRELVRRARCRVVFIENVDQLAKLLAARDTLPDLEKVVVMRPDAPSELQPRSLGSGPLTAEAVLESADGSLSDWIVRLDDLMLTGEEALSRAAGRMLETRAAGVAPRDVSTLVYTSGTLDEPTAVGATHANHLAVLDGLTQALPFEQDDVQLLTLPLAHLRGLVAYRLSVATGATLALWQGPQKLAEDLQSVRPTFLMATPRLCERVFGRILREARERGGIEQAMFHWAVSVGRERLELREKGDIPGRVLSLKQRAADQLVLRRVRDVFGGRVRFLIVGGAALRPDVAEFLTVAGVPVLDSYGLTEATAISHINRTNRFRLGTVGLPIAGVQARLADDGEVLLRGATVVPDSVDSDVPAPTAADGWLHTGDMGAVDEDGFLRITGRKKSVIVLVSGSKVSPEPIEQRIASSPYVSHVVVSGDGRSFLTALITLDEERVKQFAHERRIVFGAFRELSQHPEVYALIDGVVQEQNARLVAHEQVRKFAILDHDFSPETGELTPTLKLRRPYAVEKHRALVESFYRESY